MRYSDIGRPALYCTTEGGWAIFNGGHMAHLARWDEYCRKYTDDFDVYKPETPAETRARMTAWLESGTVYNPTLPPPDARSVELGKLEHAAAERRWQLAAYAEEHRRDELAQEKQQRQVAGAVERKFNPERGW